MRRRPEISRGYEKRGIHDRPRSIIECSRTTTPGPTAALYEAAARLTSEQYRADRGAFFKSVHGTLNHLLVTDRIWMQRFTGEGDAPNRLDAILFETFDELRAAREAEDRRILGFVEGLDDRRIEGTIKYRRVSSPEEFEQHWRRRWRTGSITRPTIAGRFMRLLTGLARPGAGTRSVVFPAADGKAGGLISRKLHRLLRRLWGASGFAAAGRMQQNWAAGCPQFPLIY